MTDLHIIVFLGSLFIANMRPSGLDVIEGTLLVSLQGLFSKKISDHEIDCAKTKVLWVNEKLMPKIYKLQTNFK